MNIREYTLGKNTSYIQLGMLTTVFLVGFLVTVIFPFYVYFFGAGVFWQFFGILLCMIVVWRYEAYRLMRYARKHEDILTIPGYFSRRFGGKHDFLRVFAATEIAILSIVISALILKETTLSISVLTGFPVSFISLVLVLFISFYIGVFGFNAISKTSIVKGIFILVSILIISIYMFSTMGIKKLITNIMVTDITGSVSEYMNILFNDGKMLGFGDFVSLISLGILAAGMPFFLGAFFSAKDSLVIKNGHRVMFVYAINMFIAAATMGFVSRGYLYDTPITSSVSKYIGLLYNKLISEPGIGKAVGILLAFLAVVAFITAIECAINVTVSVIYEDILVKGRLIRVRRSREKSSLFLLTVFVGVVIFIISECIRLFSVNTILVFICTLGCSVGPTVFLSVAWKRMNKYGCYAGLISGLICVPFFRFGLFFDMSGTKATLCDILGVNSIAPSVVASFLIIILVSLITKKNSSEIEEEFKEVKSRIMD